MFVPETEANVITLGMADSGHRFGWLSDGDLVSQHGLQVLDVLLRSQPGGLFLLQLMAQFRYRQQFSDVVC